MDVLTQSVRDAATAAPGGGRLPNKLAVSHIPGFGVWIIVLVIDEVWNLVIFIQLWLLGGRVQDALRSSHQNGVDHTQVLSSASVAIGFVQEFCAAGLPLKYQPLPSCFPA